jgi:hypothetical protein
VKKERHPYILFFLSFVLRQSHKSRLFASFFFHPPELAKNMPHASKIKKNIIMTQRDACCGGVGQKAKQGME